MAYCPATDRSRTNIYLRRQARAREYLGGKCADCGTRENLEFDHIDPTEKSFTISCNLTRRWDAVREELDKCQLLCSDCHKAKTYTPVV